MYITKMWPLLVLGGIVTHITTKLHVHGVSIKNNHLCFLLYLVGKWSDLYKNFSKFRIYRWC